MTTRTLFGTDGVRGKANRHPMTAEMMLQLGRCIAFFARESFQRRYGKPRHPRHHPVVLVGKDTRQSGYLLESALYSGILSMGADAMMVGTLPTPGIAFLTQDMRVDAGAVISASHNPFDDNGIKFFAADGFKLPDQVEAKMEHMLASGEIDDIRPTASRVGRAVRIEDAVGRYIVFLKRSFPAELSLEGLRIVIDCAHGAGYKAGPVMLRELGAEVFALGVSPDGRNINRGCGSTAPEKLQREVLKRNAHMGIALDGDADRLICVDEQGRIVDGDAVLAMCALRLARRRQLRKKTLVATIMSNLGLDEAVAAEGIKVVRTQVGDRYVVETMRKRGFNLGGEQSGHIIFLDHSTSGDGLISALQVLAAMLQEERPLSELARVVERYPQELINLRVRTRTPLAELAASRLIAEGEKALAGKGRVLVRYSGTEPKVRVMVECKHAGACERWSRRIADALREEIGAS